MPRVSSKLKKEVTSVEDRHVRLRRTRDDKTKPEVNALSIPMYGLDGKESGNLSLPEEIFAGKINKDLLAQAVRVYQNNLLAHHTSTKTRGQVSGSTRKIYKQKGTGGARHGSIKAPIFVGGGIALGPSFRKVNLDLPEKMRKAALIAALSLRFAEKSVLGVSDLEKASGKTAEMAKLLKGISKKNVLLITDEKVEKAIRGVKNLPGIDYINADQLNVLSVISHQNLLLTKGAVGKLEARIHQQQVSEEKK